MKLTKICIGALIVVGVAAGCGSRVDNNYLEPDRGFKLYQKRLAQNACITNLKQLQTAFEMAMMSGIEHPKMSDIIGPDKYIRVMPVCPAGGTYSLPADNTSNATCTLGSDPKCPHKLPSLNEN